MPYIRDKALNADGGPSPGLWGDCPIGLLIQDPNYGVFFHDDFLAFDGAVSANVGRYASAHAWRSYEDTGDSILPDETELGGVIKLSIAATNNNETWLAAGGTKGVLAKIASSAGKDLWFEARVKLHQLTAQNWFFGLAEEGLADADTMEDAGGAMADKDYVGFRVTEDDPSYIDAVHNVASGGGEIVVKDQAKLIEADVWHKLGMRFDPLTGLKFYLDGVALAGVDAVLPTATGFPDGEELTILLGGKNNNAAKIARVDWVRLAQLT